MVNIFKLQKKKTEFDLLNLNFMLPGNRYIKLPESTNQLFKTVLDSAFIVHSVLGPGLLESAYQECLLYELTKAGLHVEKQKSLPLIYKEIKLEIGYRVDLLVESQIIVETKSVDMFCDLHIAQILTYMHLSKCKLGLLANFNVVHFKDGFKRLIL